MQHNSIERLGETRIQVVFRDKQAMIRLSGNATLEHVASTLGELSKRYLERPVAVYVTMNRPDC